VKPGDTVTGGQPLFELHTDTADRFPAALADLAGAVAVGSPGEVAERPPLVMDVIRQD